MKRLEQMCAIWKRSRYPDCYAQKSNNVLVMRTICISNEANHPISRPVFGKVAQFGTLRQTERLLMRRRWISSNYFQENFESRSAFGFETTRPTDAVFCGQGKAEACHQDDSNHDRPNIRQ